MSGLPCWERPLDDAHVASADLARPAVLTEMSPGKVDLIDGHHRLAYMRSESAEGAAAVARRSSAAIDEYHRMFKEAAWLGGIDARLLVDLAAGA